MKSMREALLRRTNAGLLIRPVVTSSQTYFVRADGNDNNNGLSNNSSGAFRQITKAIEAVEKLDLNGFDVTIQVADGTYNAIRLSRNLVGGVCRILGNPTSPQNCIIEENNGVGYAVSLDGCQSYTINGFELRCNLTPNAASPVTGNSICCLIQINSTVKTDNIRYNSTSGGNGYHILMLNSTNISQTGAHNFIGNAYCAINCLQSNMNWFDLASGFPNNTADQITFNNNTWGFNLGVILLLQSNIDFFSRRFAGSWSGGNFGKIEGGLIRLRHPQLPSNVQSMTLGTGGFSIVTVS